MTKRTLKGVLLDVVDNRAEVVEIEDSLQSIYSTLRCELVESCYRKIGGRTFQILCDEEGTFVQGNKISAINQQGEVMLVGSILVISPENKDGNFESIDADGADIVLDNIKNIATIMYKTPYKMLTNCEWDV